MEELIGTIKIFAGNFAPHGWLICDGRLLNITQNAALFSIIGTTYGGTATARILSCGSVNQKIKRH